jgi:hypothetical protein
MFTEPRTNVIQSGEGFTVEVLGRTGLRYTEDARTLFVDSESLVAESRRLALYTSVMRWDPPHSEEPIDDKTKERIIENIRAAFRFRGFEIET